MILDGGTLEKEVKQEISSILGMSITLLNICGHGCQNMLVLRWNQRAHYWFCSKPKGHIMGPKEHSALWEKPSENPLIDYTWHLSACTRRNLAAG